MIEARNICKAHRICVPNRLPVTTNYKLSDVTIKKNEVKRTEQKIYNSNFLREQ